jgi:DnaJ-class molecular chaperone
MRDPYEVLGVAKDASAKDIKSAFRKQAKQFHPDQNPNDPKAKDRFNAANQAYEIVGDEEKRRQFDRGEIDTDGKPRFQGFEGAAGGDPFGGFRRSGAGGSQFEFRSGGGGGGAEDIFSEIFGQAFGRGGQAPGSGQRRQAAPQGADINATMDVSIEEIVTAAKVQAVFPGNRRISVKLPTYVEDGQTIRLKGQGEPSPYGGQPGDALVKIAYAHHPRYTVEGRDLHVDLPVQLAQAVLGAKVAVETPTGRLAVTVPAWSNSDKVLRLKGRGLPVKTGGHADLYVHVRIMLDSSDHELEQMLKARAGVAE